MIVTEKKLDETDKKIIAKAADGQTIKEIGRDMAISPHTVSIRIREMKKWFECKSLAQLVSKLSKLSE